MSLKEQIRADIDGVFLNLEEFAEEITVEGKTFPAIVDQPDYTGTKQGEILGLVEADMLVFAKEGDFPDYMSPGRCLEVNGKEMILIKYATDYGMGEAALKQNRS